MSDATFLDLIKAFVGAIVGAMAAYGAVKQKMGELIARLVYVEKRSDEAFDNAESVDDRLNTHIEKFHSK